MRSSKELFIGCTNSRQRQLAKEDNAKREIKITVYVDEEELKIMLHIQSKLEYESLQEI